MNAETCRVHPHDTARNRQDNSRAFGAVEDAPLQPSKTQMQMALESATDDYGIITTDFAGVITTWNKGAEQVLGWSKAEALGQKLDLIFTPEDRTAGISDQERSIALDQGQADDERWHLKQDGRRFWASGKMMPLRDQDGATVGYLKILRDETLRHKAEQALIQSEAALARSEAQFRAAFEQSAVSMAHLGLDGRWLRVNTRLCEMLGYTVTELLAMTLQQITHADDLEPDLVRIRQMLAGEIETYTLEKRYLHRCGSVIWAEVSVSLVKDPAGVPQYLIAVTQSIDARKLAEAALRDSEERFRAMADNIPALAWIAEADGSIVWYNRRWHEYCGTSPETMKGWDWQSVQDPAVLPEVLKQWNASTTTGAAFEMTFPLRGNDGVFRPFLTRALPVHDKRGKVTRWFGTNIDMTERLAAEAANARLAAIVMSSDDAIISFAPKDGRIMTWNSSAERLFGYGEAEAVGGPKSLILPGNHPEGKLTDVLAWALAGRPVVAYETERVSKYGERIPVAITATRMLASDGRVTGVSSIFRDLRPRLQAEAALRASEEQLRQSQKLEAIGRLAAGVAHDFNNLIQAITGGLELVMDEIEPGSPAHDFVEISLSAAKRGAGLTHQLLAYARKQVLRPQAVDLAPFLTDVQRLLARTLGPRIIVRARASAGTPPVQVDPGQLETALLNLAVNASHAMPQGGMLLLDAHLDKDDGKHVVVAVTDTGVGMDPATQAQVFEPFFTTKGVEGTGLGLSMVQGFAEQSGGRAQIASAPGKGTTVMLWLPVISAFRETAQDPLEQQAVPRGSGRVLLVDDAPDVLRTAGTFLERAGFVVVQASSGEEGLALLIEGKFDALVSDQMMTGMSGLELIEQARAIHHSLPALLITGFSETRELERLPISVATLRKPFQRRDLIQAVLQAMGRSQENVAGHAIVIRKANVNRQDRFDN